MPRSTKRSRQYVLRSRSKSRKSRSRSKSRKSRARSKSPKSRAGRACYLGVFEINYARQVVKYIEETFKQKRWSDENIFMMIMAYLKSLNRPYGHDSDPLALEVLKEYKDKINFNKLLDEGLLRGKFFYDRPTDYSWFDVLSVRQAFFKAIGDRVHMILLGQYIQELLAKK